MNYRNQVNEIVNYFRKNEKSENDFKLGVEFEHFIVDKDTLKAVSYYEDGGIEDTLKELLDKGWKGKYEKSHLLGLNKGKTVISLEPGSQLELSIGPYINITELEKEYLDFLDDIIPILDEKDQCLVAVGYQPQSKIDDIKIIPKQRYDYMFDYFKSRGKYAHNMMKGTASIQVTVDFKSEEDYIKKFRVANALSPVLYAMFDNSPFFEGDLWKEDCLRTDIWCNCDSDRCGVVELALDDSFNYSQYAEYILKRPAIFIDSGNEISYTGKTQYKEIFNPNNYSIDELEHVLTMFFPDVRTKKFIEIRMADAVPYPLNFTIVALWKGIMYNEESLNNVYDVIKTINIDDISTAKSEIIQKGLDGILKGKTIKELGNLIISLAKKGLNEGERRYLEPLEEMMDMGMTPAQLTKSRLDLGKEEALAWCILNNMFCVCNQQEERCIQ